jgi:hypothetical protein
MSMIRLTRAARSRASPMPWIRRPSPMLSPIGVRGSSEPNGSWKTICIRRRCCFRAGPSSRVMSTPPSVIDPDVGSMRRSMSRPTVVFPHPDSPTRPSVSPPWISKLTPSTARTRPTVRMSSPPLTGKCFTRSRTTTRGAPSAARAGEACAGGAANAGAPNPAGEGAAPLIDPPRTGSSE